MKYLFIGPSPRIIYGERGVSLKKLIRKKNNHKLFYEGGVHKTSSWNDHAYHRVTIRLVFEHCVPLSQQTSNGTRFVRYLKALFCPVIHIVFDFYYF